MGRRFDDEAEEIEIDEAPEADGVHAVDEDLWTTARVARAMVQALRVANRVAGPTGPKQYGNAMPRVIYDWADILGWTAEEEEKPTEGEPVRLTPTSSQVERMERAILWQSRYLADFPDLAAFLKVWLRCRVSRKKFGAECKRRGWARATAYRGRDRALAIIAEGLNRDRVPPWR